MTPLRVFIGYDSRETAAFHVLSHSIIRHASRPVAIIPLVRDQLARTLAVTFGAEGATEFTRTRFLVPFLSGFDGVSVFMDCDMLARVDVHDLWRDVDLTEDAAVWVAQHDYTPKGATKMDGQVQTAYPRKNWSSLMVFDNERCQRLTPEYVATASLMDLHRFAWLPDEPCACMPHSGTIGYQSGCSRCVRVTAMVGEPSGIGSLPLEWNWLVGEYPKNPDAKILHYTNGGPWFRGYEACDHAEDWYRERELMLTGKALA